jgi:glycosidase
MEINSKCQATPAGQAELIGTLAHRLQRIYKSEFSEGIVNRIVALTCTRYSGHSNLNESDIVLITYGNTVIKSGEKPLITLNRFLNQKLAKLFSCVHILPFFPSTSDDGFAVKNYVETDVVLGSWDDISDIASNFSLMIDLVINHVSADHWWLKQYLAGEQSACNFFIESDQQADYKQVVRPRNTPLFTTFKAGAVEKQLWTTFSADQVDLNFGNPLVLIRIIEVMLFYISKGARIIRLDAIAYLWKKPGTPCVHLPETHEIVKLLREIATFVCPGTLILTETNVPNCENLSYFGTGDEAHMIYQFTLPPLLLFTLITGNSQLLSKWAESIPSPAAGQTYLNFTASHDGIGVRPVEGILSAEEIKTMINTVVQSGGMVSEKTNADGSRSIYELNTSYLDALRQTVDGPDQYQENRFLCSQCIMMALQGIPAFFIHSLLATGNYYDGVLKTQMPRSINRRQLSEDEVSSFLSTAGTQRRIFDGLAGAIHMRKAHTAFHPEASQKIMDLGSSFFAFKRINVITGEVISCISNISSQTARISEEKLKQFEITGIDLLSQTSDYGITDTSIFRPYQTRWIVSDE